MLTTLNLVLDTALVLGLGWAAFQGCELTAAVVRRAMNRRAR